MQPEPVGDALGLVADKFVDFAATAVVGEGRRDADVARRLEHRVDDRHGIRDVGGGEARSEVVREDFMTMMTPRRTEHDAERLVWARMRFEEVTELLVRADTLQGSLLKACNFWDWTWLQFRQIRDICEGLDDTLRKCVDDPDKIG